MTFHNLISLLVQQNGEASLFEVNIRYVGGLLSAYYLTGEEVRLIDVCYRSTLVRSAASFISTQPCSLNDDQAVRVWQKCVCVRWCHHTSRMTSHTTHAFLCFVVFNLHNVAFKMRKKGSLCMQFYCFWPNFKFGKESGLYNCSLYNILASREVTYMDILYGRSYRVCSVVQERNIFE